MGSWSDLPGVLLSMIGGHIDIYDMIRFRCVCTHWRSSSPPVWQPQPPWLLLPYKGTSLCGLHLPFENKVYHIDLPEVVGDIKGFIGSGHGLVVTLQQNGSINVVNPLSRARVPLPARPELPTKIVMSSSPASIDLFIAVAIYGTCDQLAYCKVGDEKWREFVPLDPFPCRYKDVTFHRGKLYAMTYENGLMICDDINVSSPDLRECPLSSYDKIRGCYSLVSSCNSLMAIARFGVPNNPSFLPGKLGFTVFKLCTGDAARWRWTLMENLDANEVLFLGCGTRLGISMSSGSFGESRGNRIYFIDHDYVDGRCVRDCFNDLIYTFHDKKCKLLGYKCNSEMIWPCPIWFTPNPYTS